MKAFFWQWGEEEGREAGKVRVQQPKGTMLSDIYALWLREMIRFVRAKSRIVGSLAMPFFWLVIIGVGFGSSLTLPGIDYINFLAPGILAMIILFTSIFSGISVIWERQFGFLKEIMVAPVSRTSIVIGKTLGGTTVALINALIMVLISFALGVIPITFGVLPAIAYMFLAAVCFVSIGLIMASRMRSMEGFQMIMSFLIMPVFFLSGALFPIEKTPAWLQAISYVDPLRYAVDGIRSSITGIAVLPAWINLAVLAGTAIALVLAGSWMFRKSGA